MVILLRGYKVTFFWRRPFDGDSPSLKAVAVMK